MRPGRLELQEKGPEQKHIWMSQSLRVECISSSGEAALVHALGAVGWGSGPQQLFLNFPPCNPSRTGIPKQTHGALLLSKLAVSTPNRRTQMCRPVVVLGGEPWQQK